MMNPMMGPQMGPQIPMQNELTVAPSESSAVKFISIPVDRKEEEQIIEQCNKFLKAVITHSQEKKDIMRTCYAYSKSKLQDGDLLPRLTSTGNRNQNDATGRPSIFVPITRQVVKDLYSKCKLSILPNDDEYMRVLSDTEEFEVFEQDLTEGLKKKFKDIGVTEKIGLHILSLLIFGSAASFPDMEDTETWEWNFISGEPEHIDPMTGQLVAATEDRYEPTVINEEPQPTLEVFNSLNFCTSFP